MPTTSLTKNLLLPELKILKHQGLSTLFCEKKSTHEVCTRCANLSNCVYDHRWVKVKDAPIRGQVATLLILKRRFWCKPCKRPFTEPVHGILPRRRTTQRFRAALFDSCCKYRSLALAQRDYKVSSDFLYRVFYEQLELRRRKNNQYPWPKVIGLDEHGIGKNKQTGQTQFVTMVVNQSRGKLMEVVKGKSIDELVDGLRHIPGRENVEQITMDMCQPYRSFAHLFFPKAAIVADKFHVLRLLSGSIIKERKAIAGTNATRKARKLLLMSSKKLDYWDRLTIKNYLENYPKLKELYECKELLHELYRIKNYRTAHRCLDSIILLTQCSQVAEVKRLGKTLLNWKTEILNYFNYRITNARVESFNNSASIVRRQAYGYRRLNNYRLQLLNACS